MNKEDLIGKKIIHKSGYFAANPSLKYITIENNKVINHYANGRIAEGMSSVDKVLMYINDGTWVFLEEKSDIIKHSDCTCSGWELLHLGCKCNGYSA